MPLDPADMEHPEKAGLVLRWLNAHPEEANRLQALADLAEGTKDAEQALLVLHRLARAADHYGRANSQPGFSAAVELLMSDASRGVIPARVYVLDAMKRRALERAENPYPPVTLGPPQKPLQRQPERAAGGGDGGGGKGGRGGGEG